VLPSPANHTRSSRSEILVLIATPALRVALSIGFLHRGARSVLRGDHAAGSGRAGRGFSCWALASHWPWAQGREGNATRYTGQEHARRSRVCRSARPAPCQRRRQARILRENITPFMAYNRLALAQVWQLLLARRGIALAPTWIDPQWLYGDVSETQAGGWSHEAQKHQERFPGKDLLGLVGLETKNSLRSWLGGKVGGNRAGGRRDRCAATHTEVRPRHPATSIARPDCVACASVPRAPHGTHPLKRQGF